MKRIGAAKVLTAYGPLWCHLSERDGTLKLRRYSEGQVFEVPAEGSQVQAFVPLAHCKKLVPAHSYSHTEFDVWVKLLHKLELNGTHGELLRRTRGGANSRQAKSGIIIPITHLRRMYDAMKLLDGPTRQGLAKFYSETPKSLERLWNISRTTFIDYCNLDGWDKRTRKQLPPAPASLDRVENTNDFTAFIMKMNNRFGADLMTYEFVERELNPWRTRDGTFSNKLPSTKSGTGGIDLLLVRNGQPVVGEVKVKNDKDAFFALMQALTYAVELATPSQLARLKSSFPKDFGDLSVEKASVEIALLMVNAGDDRTRDPVRKLIKMLNSRGKCPGLGRITVLSNEGDRWDVFPKLSP